MIPAASDEATAPNRFASMIQLSLPTRQFTLIELLIVLVIVSAVLALIGPRVGRLPSRVVIGSATTQLKQPFADAGMRARSTGQPVTLVLERSANRIVLRDGTIDLDNVDGGNNIDGSVTVQPSSDDPDADTFRYPLDDAIDWAAGDEMSVDGGLTTFVFLPDGDASGPVLTFTIRGVPFQLSVSRLTGQVRVTEQTR